MKNSINSSRLSSRFERLSLICRHFTAQNRVQPNPRQGRKSIVHGQRLITLKRGNV